MSKLILIIGGTGAQGLPVIDALLAPQKDGSPSPYSLRILTRNPSHPRSLELQKKGCEIVEGSILDLESVKNALQGVYGAFVNTDGFSVGEKEEVFASFRIYELAQQVPTLKHYVWSGLEYLSMMTGFQPQYRCGHYDGKGRFSEFLKSQPSGTNGKTWSIITSGPYMEMFTEGLFVPFQAEDGTIVWALPVGEGHVPLIALNDFGFFTRYVFDHPDEYSGKDFQIASDLTTWNDVAAAFRKVTGKPAAYVPVSVDEYFSHQKQADLPLAPNAPGSMTWKQNFTGVWNAFKDDILKRDMAELKRINPGLRSVEKWMVENQYDGNETMGLLKDIHDSPHKTAIGPDLGRLQELLATRL